MIDILPYLVLPLALSIIAGLAWTVRKRRIQIERLKLRIDMMEHPERYPPQHPMCRCTTR